MSTDGTRNSIAFHVQEERSDCDCRSGSCRRGGERGRSPNLLDRACDAASALLDFQPLEQSGRLDGEVHAEAVGREIQHQFGTVRFPRMARWPRSRSTVSPGE